MEQISQQLAARQPQWGLGRAGARRDGRIPLRAPGQGRAVRLFFGACALLSAASLLYLWVDWPKLLSRAPNIGRSFVKLFTFDFTGFSATLSAFGESVSMTVLATIYSALLGILFGALMCRSLVKNRIAIGALSAVFTFVRAVPSVVWVLLVLVCLGFGPATGIVGLSVHSIAFFAKAYAQSFDDVGGDVVEALTAAGANRLQIFFRGILPAALSSIVAWFSLRVETNFSESTVLGMVGAGGIGFVISSNIQNYRYGRAGVAIVLVFLFAYLVETGFSKMKRAYLMDH